MINRNIKSGIRVQKQKHNYYEELVNNFHKKLKIDNSNEFKAEEVEPTRSTALIIVNTPPTCLKLENNSSMYVNPITKTPIKTKNPVVLLPKAHLNIETIFHLEKHENLVKSDECANETELD